MVTPEEKQEILNNLTTKSYIAFGFNYHGGDDSEILVDRITHIYPDSVMVHFTYGHHSLAEEIKKENIIAVGDNEKGTITIDGWRGKFILLKNHPLI